MTMDLFFSHRFFFPLTQTRLLMNLARYKSIATGTAYTTWAPGVTRGIWWGQCCLSFLVFCVVMCLFRFVCLHPVSYLTIVSNVSRLSLSILDCPFRFSLTSNGIYSNTYINIRLNVLFFPVNKIHLIYHSRSKNNVF